MDSSCRLATGKLLWTARQPTLFLKPTTSYLRSSGAEPPNIVLSEAMGEVLGLLAAVPEAELQAKRRRLRRVRSAFTFRRGASLAEPSAAEHILSEVCHAARAARSAEEARLRGERSPPLTPVGGDHSRCVLLGERRRRRPRGAWTRWPGKNPNSPTGGLVPGGYSFRLGK